MSATRVLLTKQAIKDLAKAPHYIANKLMGWIESVEIDGLNETRKILGFHDEPLKGKRRGQRSIRLSRSYRAIYESQQEGKIEFVHIKEVSKHAY